MDDDDLAHDRVRQILRARGYVFCDDGRPADTAEHAAVMSARRAEADALEELLGESVGASSTDHEAQGIGNTLDGSYEFWSSRGSGWNEAEEAVEWLAYRLKYPACVVRCVEVSVYRAHYQFGLPLYPPSHLAVDVGPSPETLHRVSQVYQVRSEEHAQVFHVPPTAAVGGYLRLHLKGKPQMQLADGRYYVAIRQVRAFGLPVPEHVLNGISGLLHSHRLCLGSGSYLPATGLCHATPPHSRTVLQRIAALCRRHRHDEPTTAADESTTAEDESMTSADEPTTSADEPTNRRRRPRRHATDFRPFEPAPVKRSGNEPSQTAIVRTSSGVAAQMMAVPGCRLPVALFREEAPGPEWEVHDFAEQWGECV
ncbi:unnamed protein product [Ostreobium quekettii]|uniref:Uncharacterized protein n=1 Tax=Ostreobium quekettii TaxID=121088 RepID=A0A8S1J3R5_9CHLO|nr:unnamed protein product [Ostreobium quekettii]|eukprot:evm.model.scf_62EXC.2 EVM.evm.TU.scf_62EXC.2   scf_62EXC:31161-36035(-)